MTSDDISAVKSPPRRRARRAGAAVLVLGLALALTTFGSAHSASTRIISTIAGSSATGTGNGDGGLATSARLNSPSGVALDADGNLYIAEIGASVVRKVDTAGTITTVAGTPGSSGFGGDGGPATSATLSAPRDVAVDSAGNIYIADTGNLRVRKVDSGGTISTVVGTGVSGYTGDGGPGTSATLKDVRGVSVDAADNVLISDAEAHVVRQLATGGTITTIAGTGVSGWQGDGGAATSAKLNGPTDVALDPSGNMLIADRTNNRIRKVDTAGTISTVAGLGTSGYTGDGDEAKSATLRHPTGIAVGSAGRFVISDGGNHAIRLVDSDGIITTVAGTGSVGFSGDDGDASLAQLSQPERAVLRGSELIFADRGNHRVRKITAVVEPAPPTFTAVAPTSPANDNSPVVTGSAEPGSTVHLYTNSSCTSAVAASGGASAFASPGFSAAVADDSANTFWATATDVAGVVSVCSPTSISYLEDSTAPDAPAIGDAPASPGNDGTPTWSFSGAGATFECELKQGSTVISAFAACTSAKTYDISAGGDGGYTFSVRATDAAGNVGAATTSSYTLDTDAPPAPSFTSTPGATGYDTTPAWAFSAEDGARLECRLMRDGEVFSGFATCTSPQSYDLSDQPDGVYTISVRAIDPAGNTGAAADHSYTLDTTSAGTPTITSTPGGLGRDGSPTWGFSDPTASGLECRLKRGSTVVSSFESCTSPRTYDLSGEPDGTYTLAVRSLDAFGRSGHAQTDDYTLDRSTPGAPSIDSAPPAASNTATSVWGFSGEAGATFECRLARGDSVVSNWAGCATPKGYDMTAEPDAAYTFAVRAIDGAGNVSSAATRDYRRDTATAEPSITKTAGAIGRDATPTWRFSAAESGTLECALRRGGTVVVAAATCTSPWTPDLSAERDAAYTFVLRASDEAGNTSAAVTDSYELDREAPGAPDLTSSPTTPGRDTSPAFRFASADAASFQCALLRGGRFVREWAGCSSPREYNIHTEPDGEYTFRVRAIDIAGNIGDFAPRTYTLETSTVGGGSGPAVAAPPPPPPPPAPPPPMPPEEPADAPAEEPAAEEAEEEDTAAAGAPPGRRADLSPSGAAAAAAGTDAVLRAGQDAEARAEEEHKRGKRKQIKEKAVRVLKNVGQAAEVVGEKTAFPVALLIVVVFFLGLQDRIDRNDPKLALAPVFSDPDLSFEPPERAGAPVAPALAVAGQPPPP